MHIVHDLRIEDDKIIESVNIYRTVVDTEPVESYPREYPIELMRDPVMCAVESLCFADMRAGKFDKTGNHTFYSNMPRAAEAYVRGRDA